jgi:death-on-curing protein
MITVEIAIKIQSILIEKFGGASGIRDKSLLESALGRPYQTFDKKDLYNTPIEKSAALIESIINNHPFIDGNKRFGYVAMRLLLLEEGLDLMATEDEKYDFVIAIAKGELKYSKICDWINKHIKS